MENYLMPFPTKRTPEIEKEILDRMSKGEPLAVICRSDEKFPHPTTWNDWCVNDETLNIAHGRARDLGYDAIAADCLEIADETGNDTKYGKNGEAVPDGEWISRSRLRVETRLKLLAKWDPRRYGDKVQLAGDGGGPIQSTVSLSGLTPEQLEAIASAKIG